MNFFDLLRFHGLELIGYLLSFWAVTAFAVLLSISFYSSQYDPEAEVLLNKPPEIQENWRLALKKKRQEATRYTLICMEIGATFLAGLLWLAKTS